MERMPTSSEAKSNEKRSSLESTSSGVMNLEHMQEEKYTAIPLPILVKQYENLKEFEGIISRDIRNESQEDGQSNIARGRELLEEIKRELHLESDASDREVTDERKGLHDYLKSIGMASDDGQ